VVKIKSEEDGYPLLAKTRVCTRVPSDGTEGKYFEREILTRNCGYKVSVKTGGEYSFDSVNSGRDGTSNAARL
jgi:hypothetical protein